MFFVVDGGVAVCMLLVVLVLMLLLLLSVERLSNLSTS